MNMPDKYFHFSINRFALNSSKRIVKFVSEEEIKMPVDLEDGFKEIRNN